MLRIVEGQDDDEKDSWAQISHQNEQPRSSKHIIQLKKLNPESDIQLKQNFGENMPATFQSSNNVQVKLRSSMMKGIDEVQINQIVNETNKNNRCESQPNRDDNENDCLSQRNQSESGSSQSGSERNSVRSQQAGSDVNSEQSGSVKPDYNSDKEEDIQPVVHQESPRQDNIILDEKRPEDSAEEQKD